MSRKHKVDHSNKDQDAVVAAEGLEENQATNTTASINEALGAKKTPQIPAETQKEIDELREKIESLQSKADEAHERALRIQAEAQNTERRARNEVLKERKFGLEKLINELLQVIDSLEHGITAAANNEHADSLRDGMELTLKMFLDVLAKFHVVQLNPQGELFDPALHEALSMQPDPKAEPNSVLQVVQKGYQLHERVIRPARVIVAQKA